MQTNKEKSMYSEEIDQVLRTHGYHISNRIYRDICSGSSQIVSITYDPYSSTFTICTKDNWSWNFKVYYEN